MVPNLPDDLIDPAEGPLARRVGAYTDQAVFPIDPVAIAASAAATAGRRRTLGERLFGGAGAVGRLGLVAAAAVLITAGAVVVGGGARGLFPATPAPTANVGVITIRTCTPDDVDAVITVWDGAAGHRIATVELRQIGSTECSVERFMQPWLAGGDGTQLIMGKPGAHIGTIFMQPGDVLHTLVQAGNYCGPDPVAPVTVAFNQGGAVFVATALTQSEISGVPPCLGTAGPTDDVTMQPWSPGPATTQRPDAG